MRCLKDQRGVAMVTVLLVGAVLTVVSSTAAFITIEEFNSTNDDLKASRALAFAEAGLDRALLAMKQEQFGWGETVMAGCPGYPVIDSSYSADLANVLSGTLANGTYEVEVSRDQDQNAVACPSDVPELDEEQIVNITSTGSHPDAVRTVRQTIAMKWRGLPIGLYAKEGVDASGTGDVTDVSLVTPGPIDGREKISFVGFDPFYDVGDFWPDDDVASEPTDTTPRYLPGHFTSASTLDLPAPAAAHAVGTITQTNGTAEHPPQPNCTFNGNSGTRGQSVWDGSGSAPATPLTTGCTVNPNRWVNASYSPSRPPTANFQALDAARVAPTPTLELEDYEFLKGSAQDTGLYCSYLSGGNQPDFCTGAGSTPTGQNIDDSDLPADQDRIVVYIEFPPGTDADHDSPQQTIEWTAQDFEPCVEGEDNRTVVLVVRNGSVALPTNATLMGAIIAPEGTVSAVGGHTTEGTVIARRIDLGGNGEFLLSECWLTEVGPTFLQIEALSWQEVDRA